MRSTQRQTELNSANYCIPPATRAHETRIALGNNCNTGKVYCRHTPATNVYMNVYGGDPVKELLYMLAKRRNTVVR